jgi:hypothetical protein
MTMMLGVACALLGAEGALAHAGRQQLANDDVVRLGRPGKDPRDEVAQIGAIQAKRDARPHLRHVGFDEIRIRARRARLDTVQASVDRCRYLSESKRQAARGGLQHLARVRHPTSLSKEAQPSTCWVATALVSLGLKLELVPHWLRSADFRLAFTSGVSANKVCFERELLDHYRLVFEKTPWAASSLSVVPESPDVVGVERVGSDAVPAVAVGS